MSDPQTVDLENRLLTVRQHLASARAMVNYWRDRALSSETEPPRPARHYVLGFAFQDEFVWLIQKQRPAWQAGRLNGIGGKVEPGETPKDAMCREFKEEAGRRTTPADWRHVVDVGGTDPESFLVHVFTTELGSNVTLRTMTDEELFKVPLIRGVVLNPDQERLIRPLPEPLPNLSWLIPLSRDPGHASGSLYQAIPVPAVFQTGERVSASPTSEASLD